MIIKIYLWSVVICAICLLICYFALKDRKAYINNEIGDFYGNELFALAVSFIPVVNTYLAISFIWEVTLGIIIDYLHLFFRFIRFKIYKFFKRNDY